MPLYTYRDRNTEELFDVRLDSWEDQKPFLEANPHLERYYGPGTAPSIVGGVTVRDKVGGFREVLSKVAEAHPASPLANDHGSRSIKQVQTAQAVQKWKSKTSGL